MKADTIYSFEPGEKFFLGPAEENAARPVAEYVGVATIYDENFEGLWCVHIFHWQEPIEGETEFLVLDDSSLMFLETQRLFARKED